MAGYLSLFYDDARLENPFLNLQETKNNIYENAQKVFIKPPDSNVELDLISFTTNSILSNIEQAMQKGEEEGLSQSSQIPYWEVNVQTAIARVKKATTEVGKIDKTLEYIGEIQTYLSNALEKCKGVVSSDLIAQLKSNKESLASIASGFGAAVDKSSFEKAFWGAVQGGIRRAQGILHEAALALAAAVAQQHVNEVLVKNNESCRVIIEQTGGTLREDSALKALADKGKLNLGNSNNAKNDITIVILGNGDAQVIWTAGLSAKSTGTVNPKIVHVVSTSIGTLLNKVYNQETYINMAGALGTGDWAGSSKGIAGLAKKHDVTTSGATLATQWKEIVYNTIYSQIIDLFSGMFHSGILNNAQYMIINSKPISMYSIFQKLKQLSSSRSRSNDFSIPGIKIEGAQAAANRSLYTKQNVNAFVRLKNGLTPAEARIQRSSIAWDGINKSLQNAKISISLKYAELGLGATI